MQKPISMHVQFMIICRNSNTYVTLLHVHMCAHERTRTSHTIAPTQFTRQQQLDVMHQKINTNSMNAPICACIYLHSKSVLQLMTTRECRRRQRHISYQKYCDPSSWLRKSASHLKQKLRHRHISHQKYCDPSFRLRKAASH